MRVGMRLVLLSVQESTDRALPVISALSPSWQYFTVCYAYRVNHANGTESKHKCLSLLPDIRLRYVFSACTRRINDCRTLSRKVRSHIQSVYCCALLDKSVKSDAADSVAVVREKTLQRIWQVVYATGYARQSIWLFITRQQRKPVLLYSVPSA